jgi:hypothetical protein
MLTAIHATAGDVQGGFREPDLAVHAAPTLALASPIAISAAYGITEDLIAANGNGL